MGPEPRATQRFCITHTSVGWNAKIKVAPGVPVRVAGTFFMGEDRGSAFSPEESWAFPADILQRTGEIAPGELLRQIAEPIWFPTPFCPVRECPGKRSITPRR